jgi:hypothetical protein
MDEEMGYLSENGFSLQCELVSGKVSEQKLPRAPCVCIPLIKHFGNIILNLML